MRYILDCDTGIDDALAITYALGRVGKDLLAVTTTFGNTTLNQATQNTLDLLDALGHEEVDVVRGADHPWDKEEWTVSSHLHAIHGYNGIGNVKLPTSKREAKEDAPSYMIETAKKYGKDLALICVGPLTNLAEAVKRDKDAIASVGRIVIMGGALTVQGNIRPYAEANIFNDAPAAKYVFESGLDIHMIGLDVTLQTIITGEDIISWRDCPTDKARYIYDAASYYYSNEFGEVTGGAMHDPLAFEAAVDPSIITNWYKAALSVETGEFNGRTISTRDLLNQPERHICAALEVDAETFMERFVETVKRVLE